MKILFLASDPQRTGGIQRFNADLAAAARKAGAEIEMLIREKFSAPGYFAAACRTAFRGKPDFIWCGHVNFAPVGWFLSWFGFRYAVFTHGIEAWHLSRFPKMMLRRAAAVSAVSNFTAGRLEAQCPWLRGRVFILPDTVDGAEFVIQDKEAAKAKFGWSGKKIILTVARLDARERYKGYDRILKILPELVRDMPEARYVLAGDGSDLPRIKEEAAKLGMESYLILPGRLDKENLAAAYNAADVFAMPSTGEGFGIVFLEALACGVPVVAGNKDGSSDALQNGKLGVLIDPEDSAALAASIRLCLQKRLPPQLADPRAVRERALQAFGADAFERRTALLLQTLASGIK